MLQQIGRVERHVALLRWQYRGLVKVVDGSALGLQGRASFDRGLGGWWRLFGLHSPGNDQADRRCQGPVPLLHLLKSP